MDHAYPKGETERHTAHPDCPCGPFEQSYLRGDGSIGWQWVHEPIRRRWRLRASGSNSG